MGMISRDPRINYYLKQQQRRRVENPPITYRSVFEFNGTQWGELSAPIVLDGDFEIGFTIWGLPEGSSLNPKTVFSIFEENSTGKNIHVGRRNGNIFTFSFYSDDLNVDLTGLIDWNSINKFSFVYDSVNNTKYMYLNGDEVGVKIGGPGLSIDWQANPKTYVMKRLSGNTGITAGVLFDLRIWIGSGESKKLVRNIKFDNPTSDYQRNYASPIADENDPDWSGAILQNALPEDWIQIEKRDTWNYWREVGNESNILEIAQ